MIRRTLALAVTAALALVGCGNDEPAAAPTASAAPTLAAASTSLPSSATAALSTTTTNAPIATTPTTVPQRIVSLSPSLTEMLYAVGAGEQVVAVDTYSDYPAAAPRTDLSGFKPNIEAIAQLTPDLVVLASDRDGIVDALGRIGIPTLLLPTATTLDDAYAQLAEVGVATGHVEEATTTVASMRQQIDALVAEVPERETPLTYFYELADDGNTVTSQTFIGNVLSLAGLTSIADAAPDAAGSYPQLSAEAVLAADPTFVFMAHSDGTSPTPDELAARPGWSELQAVRNGRVLVLETDIASRWGPRVVDLLAAVVDATRDTT